MQEPWGKVRVGTRVAWQTRTGQDGGTGIVESWVGTGTGEHGGSRRVDLGVIDRFPRRFTINSDTHHLTVLGDRIETGDPVRLAGIAPAVATVGTVTGIRSGLGGLVGGDQRDIVVCWDGIVAASYHHDQLVRVGGPFDQDAS